MALITFTGHRWYVCRKKGCTGCHRCRNKNGMCVQCGGFGAAVTTDCPGERVVRGFIAEMVSAGKFDYRRNEGWVLGPSRNYREFVRLFRGRLPWL